MSGYIVRFKCPDGTTGGVLTNEENGPCAVEVFATLIEAEGVAQEMRDAYSYTGLTYSVETVGELWQ